MFVRSRSLSRLLGRSSLFALFGLLPLLTVACEPVAFPVDEVYDAGRGANPGSSRIALSARGDLAYVLLPDNEEVALVDLESGNVLLRQGLAGGPDLIAPLSSDQFAVTLRTLHEVVVIDDRGRVTARAPLGGEPTALATSNGDIYVGVGAGQAVLRFDLALQTQTVLSVPGEPAALAADADEVWIGTRKGSNLFVADARTFDKVTAVSLQLDYAKVIGRDAAGERLVGIDPMPNHVASLTLTSRGTVAVPHGECVNGEPFVPGQSQRYYGQGSIIGGLGSVVMAAVSHVDRRHQHTIGQPGTDMLDPLLTRSSHARGRGAALPAATAMADDGRLEATVMKGTGAFWVRSTATGELVLFYPHLPGLSSVVVTPDGDRFVLFNEFSQTLLVFAVPDPDLHHQYVQENGRVWIPAPLLVLELATRLPTELERGRRLFSSSNRLTSRTGLLACASCHGKGGGDDGLNWNTFDGPRQTPPLWGGIAGAGPLHWRNDVTTFADLNKTTIQEQMGGQGLNPTQLKALELFVDSLAPPRALAVLPLTSQTPGSQASRFLVPAGRALFESEELDCRRCHVGDLLTDENVYTGFTGDRDSATPPLLGLAFTAPYLSDGSEATLEDFVEHVVRTDRMGFGSQLDDDEAAALVAYLKSL